MIISQGILDVNKIIKPYQNIISLVPSISWLLFDLQLQNNIKGITKFCKAEKNQQINYVKIGGTKNPDLQKINELKPDLILANLEENRKEDIEELSKNHLVYLSNIKDLNSMYQMIEEVSKLTGRERLGNDFIAQIRMKQLDLFSLSKPQPKISVAYLIWKDPYMTIGSDTFIHYMLDLAGFINVFHEKKRYPTVTQTELLLQNPEFILLSSEPFPFSKKHLMEFNPLNARLVDGRMFSWYGSFILQSFVYLNAFKSTLNNSIMKFIISFIMSCVLSMTYAQNQKIPHQYTVSLNRGYNMLEVSRGFSKQLMINKITTINTSGNIISIEFTEENTTEEEIQWLKVNPSIANFKPVVTLEKRDLLPSGCNPNDSYYLSQYDMELMKFDEAWCFKNEGLSPSGDTLVVGVIDEGFNFEWRDLLPNIFANHLDIPDNGIDDDKNGYIDDYYGFNAQLNAGDNHQNDTHGTQVISVLGAKGNNKYDISGTNQNIKILLCSASTDAQLLKCYYYFVKMKRDYLNSGGTQGAYIVGTNLSAGFSNSFPDDFPLICQVYDTLGKVGILNSVATINDNEDIDIVGDIPGLCPSDYLIVVTNTNRNDQKVTDAGFSQTNVDLGASGEKIPMIDNQGNVDDNSSGTSFASPHVAGAISLLCQYCPKINLLSKTDPPAAAKLIKDFILKGGDDLGDLAGITRTGKRLNMIKSLQCLNSYCNDDTAKIKCSITLKNDFKNTPIEITFNPEAFGDYNLFVYNNLGQLIVLKTLHYIPGSDSHHIIEIVGWPSGVYHVLIEGLGTKCSKSLVKI